MKLYKIVIFIFSVILGLAFISIVFPKDGITIGNIKLEFPTLTEVMTPAESPAPADEPDKEDEAMQAKLDSLHNMKDAEFLEYCKTSPSRIYMPNNDLTYLDDFFKALDNAKKIPVRILHYGDSQLEGDLISASFREEMQKAFGGTGLGMLPAQEPVGKETVTQTTTPQLERLCAYGPADWRGNTRNHGPMAQTSHVSGSASFSFYPSSNPEFAHAYKYNKISVAMQGSGTISATANGQRYQLKPESEGEGVRIFSVTLPESVGRSTVSVSGNMYVHGIMLDSDKGVAVDNVPMRGCSGTIFTSIAENSFAPFFKERNIGLIMLQYGGNYLDAHTTESDLQQYSRAITKNLQYFKKIAPKSKILFMGPADMGGKIGGKAQSYPMLPALIKMLRETCNKEGVAFWDMCSTMGGPGTIVKWVEAKPALAYRDYTHFTPRGARRMGGMLFNTMKLYYNYYCFRSGKNGLEERNDTTRNSKK